jgi:hypothetical protein
MRTVIGEILPLAVVVTVSPINIVAAILLLFSRRPVRNASAYLGGFVVGVAAVLAGLTAVAGALGLSTDHARSRGASIALLVLGVALLVVAVRKFRSRPGPGESSPMPKWMDGIAGFGPGKSFGTGAAVGALNPKNIAVAVASAVVVATAGLGAGSSAVVIVVYTVVASAGVAAPIVVVLLLGDRSEGVLQGWQGWLGRNNAAMMAVLYLIFGVILVGKGIGGI